MDERIDNETTILLVDQQPPERSAVPHVLPSCAVTLARNGLDALRELNAKPFDVYVCDSWLPDWSGRHLCRTVLRDDPNALVLIYSAMADDSNRSRALRAGAAEYLRVPLDPALLRERILRLGARAAQGSLRARPFLQRSIVETVQARAAEALTRAQGDEAAASRMLERSAAPSSRRVFFDAGGTAAYFRRWWKDDFAGAWAVARDEALAVSRKRASEQLTARPVPSSRRGRAR